VKSASAFFLVLVLVGLGAWFLVSTSDTNPPSEHTEAEIAQIEEEVREGITSLANSVNDGFLRGDAEAVLSGYTPDARVYWPGLHFTRDELQDWAVDAFQTTTWTGVGFKVIELFVHGDAAYAIWEWSGTSQTEGREPESVIWDCFSRFEKVDGGWKDDREVCGQREAPPEG
jgi:ketosteroid isomerase-like protein